MGGSMEKAGTRLYTVEEAKALPDAEAYELVDGELKERGMGNISSWFGSALLSVLFVYANANRRFYVLDSQAALCLLPSPLSAPRRHDGPPLTVP